MKMSLDEMNESLLIRGYGPGELAVGRHIYTYSLLVTPDGVRVLSAAGRTQATAAMTQAFMTNLTAMSLLAMLVGMFLIFNAMSFSIVQRRKLFGRLRAIGVTQQELFHLILFEAVIVAMVSP